MIIRFFKIARFKVLSNVLIGRHFSSNPTFRNKFLDIKTAPTKDVILFKYENPKFFKMVNFFGISQFCVWSYLSYFIVTSLKNAPVDKDKLDSLPWWGRINLGEKKYRIGLGIGSFLFGYIVLFCTWTYTLRSVRYLVLNQGGKVISFVTYTPFGNNRIMKVPLNKISAAESRVSAKAQLPIKVKGYSFYYILDMKGEFLQKELFDATAGLSRRI